MTKEQWEAHIATVAGIPPRINGKPTRERIEAIRNHAATCVGWRLLRMMQGVNVKCIACEGTGEASNGFPCEICGGKQKKESSMKKVTKAEQRKAGLTVDDAKVEKVKRAKEDRRTNPTRSLSVWVRGDMIETKQAGHRTPLCVLDVTDAGMVSLIDSKREKLFAPMPATLLSKHGYVRTSTVPEETMNDLPITECSYTIEKRDGMDFGDNVVVIEKVSKTQPRPEDVGLVPGMHREGPKLQSIPVPGGWAVSVAGAHFESNASCMVNIQCGELQSNTAWIAIVPAATEHTLQAASKAFVWWAYLIALGNKGMPPMVLRTVQAIMSTPKQAGKYSVRLFNNEDWRQGGIECAAFDIDVK